MSLLVPIRHTVHFDFKEALTSKLSRNLTRLTELYPQNDHQSVLRDVNALVQLRTQVEALKEYNSYDVEILTNYATGLVALAKKADLNEISFPWVNSISCSRTIIQGSGLWYEILNVLFNAAACLVNEAANTPGINGIQHYKKGAGIFQYAITEVVPNLVDSPPFEIGIDVLKFLKNYCLIRITDLQVTSSSTLDATNKWNISQRYGELCNTISSVPTIRKDWCKILKDRSAELASVACLDLSKHLHRSRKRDDRFLEKGALLKCIELGITPEIREEAEAILREPLNRRSKSCLNDLEEVTAFVPAAFFSLQEKEEQNMVDHIPFDADSSDLFDSLLPSKVLFAPYILQQKFLALVDSSICSKLYENNHNVRLALTQCNMPTAVELTSRPGDVPGSLVSLVKRIAMRLSDFQQHPSVGITETGGLIHPLYNLCKDALAKCETDYNNKSSGVNSRDSQRLQILSKNISVKLNEMKESVKNYRSIFLLLIHISRERDDTRLEEKLAKFIQIPQNKTHQKKQRSKPAFLSKVETICSNISNTCDKRDSTGKNVMDRASHYDFPRAVREFLSTNSVSELTHSDLQKILDTAMLDFADDLEFVTSDQKVNENQVREIQSLRTQYRNYSRQLLVDEGKLQAAHILLLVGTKWFDIDHDLTSCYNKMVTIRNLIEFQESSDVVLTDKTNEVRNQDVFLSSDPNEKPKFSWKPGMPIDIRIK